MHRYDRAILNEIHLGWLFVPICIWLVLLSMALSIPVPHYAVVVRHALPDPYVPGCYTTEWRSGSYCEFRPVKRHYRN
jgi:hypothetical protein